MLKNSNERYGAVAQIFHWGMFALFISLFVVAELMEEAPKGPERKALYDLHKSLGITGLFVVFLRLSWRLSNPVPAATGAVSKWVEKAATASHFFLYAVMFLMPLSGYFMSVTGGREVSWFGIITLPSLFAENEALHEFGEELHGAIWAVTMVFLAVHALAALWHHFIVKDNVFRRMLPVRLK